MWCLASAVFVACFVIVESTSATSDAEAAIPRPNADKRHTSVDFPSGTIEHFLSSLVIQSLGEWDDGKITVQATFAVPSSFTWQLSSRLGGPFSGYTRGHSKHADTTRITTLLTFDPTSDDFMAVALKIMIQEGHIYVRLDVEALRSPGVMRFNVSEILLDAPNEVIIQEQQTSVQFVVTSSIVRSWPTFGISAMHTYLDSSKFPLKEKFRFLYSTNNDRGFTGSLSFGSRTIHVGSYGERFGGSVNVNLGVKLGIDVGTDNNYVKTLNVVKTVRLISQNPVATNPDLVAIPSYIARTSNGAENVTFPDCIADSNLYCAAYGNKRPTIRILKEGRVLQTYEVGWPGVFTEVVYPIDDKSLSSVRGLYTCEATNGEMTISRLIRVS